MSVSTKIATASSLPQNVEERSNSKAMVSYRTRRASAGILLGGVIGIQFLLVACASTPSVTATSRPSTPQRDTQPATSTLTGERRASATPAKQRPTQETLDSGVRGIASPKCTEENGRIERGEYPSHILGEYVPVLIYLPACYPEGDRYPVVYLLHGKPQDETHWLILGLDDLADQAILAGSLPPLVFVMPLQPEPLFTQTTGGEGSYEDEFLTALLPFVESHFLVRTDAAGRALAGISRGGVWALEIAFRHADEFGAVGALSPALNVNAARPEYDPFELVDGSRRMPARIFLGSGDVDSARAETQRLHQLLQTQGVQHRYTIAPGGHEGATWERLTSELLIYLTSPW